MTSNRSTATGLLVLQEPAWISSSGEQILLGLRLILCLSVDFLCFFFPPIFELLRDLTSYQGSTSPGDFAFLDL